MAEVIQPSQVELIKNRDQVIFAWTDAKSDARTIKNLKEIGVDGVIYDRYLSYTFVHGLRTPNEGKNQRYLKNLADVADKICFGRT